MGSARSRARELGVIAACFAVGALLRLRGLFTDFWLDEIWSLAGVRGLGSAVELVTRLHSDNNHLLNSLWLYWLGERPGWYAYRVPALVAGAAAIVIVWVVGRRRSVTAGALATVLFSTSYLMILYGSEARGYGPMILFGLVALAAAPRIVETGRGNRPVVAATVFAAAAVAGLLSHLLFLHVYVGIAVWSVVAAWRAADRTATRLLVGAHSVVLTAFGLLWVAFIRHLPDPAGPVRSYPDVLVNAASLAFGGPAWEGEGAAAFIAPGVALVVVLVVVGEIALSLREKPATWLPLAVGGLLAPGLTLLIVRPQVVFVRYFLVAILAAYLLAAGFLARLARGTNAGRVVCAVLLALVLVGQARHLIRFHEHGRGAYLAAMRYIADNTAGETATIGSDHPFRNGMMVDFYAPFVPSVRFVHGLYRGGDGAPEWWLAHRFDGQAQPPPIVYIGTVRYRRSAVFPHGSLSGWTWFVHRRWPTAKGESL